MLRHTKYTVNTAWVRMIMVQFQLKLYHHHFWKARTISYTNVAR